MPRELINAKITHVSYVDKAAIQSSSFFEIRKTSELLQGSKDPCERSRRAKTC